MNKPYSNIQLYGVTPLYYLLMDNKARHDFNEIISYTDINVATPFIDAILDLLDTIYKICMGEDVKELSMESYNMLRGNSELKLLYNIYSTRGIIIKSALTEIKENGLVSFKLEGITLKIGKLDFESLIALSSDSISQKLETEMENLSVVLKDGDNSFQAIQEGINRHEKFIEALSYGIALIQKRIERVDGTLQRDFRKPLTFNIKSVQKSLINIDSAMMGENNGVKDEKTLEFSKFLKNVSSELGLSTEQHISSKFDKFEGSILKLSKKVGKNNASVLFEDKKKKFENIRIICNSRLETLKGSNKLSVYYF